MRAVSTVLLLLGAIFLPSCAHPPVRKIEDLKPTILLISMDGFRWDYPDKVPTPNLHRLTDDGVQAKSLIPVFPTKTFPSHYSMVTGLYPEKHGIIGNRFYASDLNADFNLHERDRSLDPKFWLAEPFWATAQRQGQISASMYWVGSDANIPENRPKYWKMYDPKTTRNDRVDQILSWLDLPAAERPTFLTLYFEDTDNKGHSFGPESDEVKKAIADLDVALGRLEEGLEERGLWDRLNIILVSDHGMTTMSKDRIAYIDDVIPIGDIEKVTDDIVLQVRPKADKEASVEKALTQLDPAKVHMTCYRKKDIPARWHFRASNRIAPVICVADEGWLISTHSWVDSPKFRLVKGNHGFDNQLPSMQGVFVAHGPAFKKGLKIPSFINVDVYPLMARILGIKPLPNDANLNEVKGMLSE